MPSPKRIALAPIRRTLAHRIEAGSLRAVAKQVGMSPSGLQKFIDGSQPYSATRRRLERWYVRESGYRAQLTAESARAALSILGHDLPAEARAKLHAELIAVLEASYHTGSQELPRWLKRLKSEIRE
ncbi:MAG: hypothetical protein WEE89_04320 [Gemmatimonadota bacterium]